MLGEKATRAILQKTLSLARADQVQVLITGEDSHLTRFANSYIHQNVSESNAVARVKTIIGKRVGVASTNDLSDGGLQKAVEAAQTIARYQPEQPELPPLPGPASYGAALAFSEATAAYSPEQRARAVGAICGRASSAKLVASGAFTTSQKELGIGNSNGLFAYYPSTLADLNTVIMSDDSSGYAGRTSWEVGKIDAERAGIEAVDKALQSRNPTAIEPGAYTVILEEYAVADILRYLGYLGFGALALQEGRSFMTGKLGQPIMDARISIVDDGLDAIGIPMPFDFEGAPKQRVEIIKNGVANAVVYDAATAQKDGKRSTGHSLPTPNTFGPMAGNLFMSAGQNSKEEMLASTERGLWVTRFHYVNPLHPLKATLTGMTRDGAFLIEKGKLIRPVKNLRFTQSMIEALSNVEMIGRERHCEEAFFGALVVPALKLRDFHFTGATEF